MSDKRVLVDWLLDAFECRYKDKWQKERFSVLGDADCGHKRADLDFIFFWKIYDQGWFARQSGLVFGKLRDLAGGGSKMVRSMAAISPDHAEHLKSACETESLPSEVQKAFTLVRGGWRVLGWAVKAAKQLHGLYPVEETSYIGRWLADFICNRQWTGNYEDLVHCINGEVQEATRDLKDDWQALPRVAKGFLEQKLVDPPRVHLTGAGPSVMSYFFRDWIDVTLWKYMWKHDTTNENFWRLASQILGPTKMGPQGNDIRAVLSFLTSLLSRKELEDGALARVNTAVYRVMSDYGKGWKEQAGLELRRLQQGEG